MEEIETALTVPIPEDATQFTHRGTPRSGFLEVNFKAPSESAETFLGNFCEGVFHQAYNPFESINIAEPFTYTYPIFSGKYGNGDTYYSFSPDTSDEMFGNKCLMASNTSYMVLVDKSNPQLYVIRIEVGWSCEICDRLQPETVTPIEDVAIEFLGFSHDHGTYILTGEEMCFGIVRSMEMNPLLYVDVSLEVDGEFAASARVADTGELIERRNAAGESVEAEASGNESYYCFNPDVSQGSYSVSIQVTGRYLGQFDFIK
jgi:hypothetical protein